MRLSRNFSTGEFACKDGTSVPSRSIPALRRLCRRMLEPARRRFGQCTVNSGYRHRAYNRRIGGARFSQHIYDEGPGDVAADVRFKRGSPRAWYAYLDSLNRRRNGIGLYVLSGFVHVDNRRVAARWRGN